MSRNEVASAEQIAISARFPIKSVSAYLLFVCFACLCFSFLFLSFVHVAGDLVQSIGDTLIVLG